MIFVFSVFICFCNENVKRNKLHQYMSAVKIRAKIVVMDVNGKFIFNIEYVNASKDNFCGYCFERK